MFNKIMLIVTIIPTMLLLLFTNVAYAEQNMTDYSIEKEYAELFLTKIGHNTTVSNPVPLVNLENRLEAVCFSIDSGGYLIININDLSIPELSFVNQTPFTDQNELYIYNGPLSHMVKKEGKLIDLKSKVEIDYISSNNIEYIYSKDEVNKNAKLDELMSESQKSINSAADSGVQLSTKLKTWTKSGGYCGSIAAAIVLMYYDKVKSDNFVATSNENSGLIDIMIKYIDGSTPGSSTDELRNGLLKYINNQNVKNFTVATLSSFNFATLKERINSFGVPVIIDTDNHPTYSEHWIICHGYYDYSSGTDYVIVNDGWGSNDIWVACDSYLDDLVYVSP